MYHTIVSRCIWITFVRVFRRLHYGSISFQMFCQYERAFRRYLAYVYECKEDEAQSVVLWNYIEQSSHVSHGISIWVRLSLERFRTLSEGRGGDNELADLIHYQRELQKCI